MKLKKLFKNDKMLEKYFEISLLESNDKKRQVI